MPPRALALLLALGASLVAVPAEAVRVRVRGGAELQAQARFPRGSSELELRALLTDDDRLPLERAWVELRDAGPLRLDGAVGCPERRVSVAPLAGGLRVQSGSGGEICLRWDDAPAAGSLRLRFPGDSYHGAAELTARFDRSRPQLLDTRLGFEPRPTVVDLAPAKLTVTATLSLSLPGALASRAGLPITLWDERAELLASARTGGDGKARLTVDVSRLADPGPGTLAVRFAGNAELAPSSDTQSITRRVAVSIALARPVEPADPGGEATVAVVLRAVRGRVDAGIVEAVADGRGIASASVHEGAAELVVPLDAGARRPLALRLRYLPASPYFVPSATLAVAVPVAPPSPLLQILLSVAVVVAATWVFISWRRSDRRPTVQDKLALAPGVHVVTSVRGARHWQGTVLDAHDGGALAGVEIVVRAPALQGDGVLLRTASDRHGKFAFDLDARPDGAEIVAESATHSPERTALPAGGTLRIALGTRRRAVLRRLVRWARRRGRPYDHRPEPTPRQVRDATDREEVGAWASAVETAAFGPAEVDAKVEQHLETIEPGRD